MRHHVGILGLILGLAATCGCQLCCCGKRDMELESPTDIRQSHFWCLGEDAIFAYPCGPSPVDYGLKPTCWREWPAGGARCHEPCDGPTHGSAMPLGPPRQWIEHWQPPDAPIPYDHENPFRDDSEPIPAPVDQGAQTSRRANLRGPQAERRIPTPRAAFGPAVPKEIARPAGPSPTAAARRIDAAAPASVPSSYSMGEPFRPQATLGPASSPAPPLPPHDPRGARSALRMVVSAPIDTPQQSALSAAPSQPVATPTTATGTAYDFRGYSLSPPSAPPTASPKLQPQPPHAATIHNNYVPKRKPFRLATRASQTKTLSDPALEGKTLSALETLMSD
jgi:hypothetical protein